MAGPAAAGTDYGSSTDTGDWPDWFTDTVMGLGLRGDGLRRRSNTHRSGGRVRTPSSCSRAATPTATWAPTSPTRRPSTTACCPTFRPPRQDVRARHPAAHAVRISTPLKTRELCNWLIDRRDRVAEGPDHRQRVRLRPLQRAHSPQRAPHRGGRCRDPSWSSGCEHPLLRLPPSGDDHPNATGNDKATASSCPC